MISGKNYSTLDKNSITHSVIFIFIDTHICVDLNIYFYIDYFIRNIYFMCFVTYNRDLLPVAFKCNIS